MRKADTSYTDDDAASLERLLSASTIDLAARPADADSDVQRLIAAWVSAQSTNADAGEELVSGLNSTRSARDRISHPLNVATLLSQSVRFDHPLPSAGESTSVPSYDAEGLRGIRLDSAASKSSLYLFYGDSKSISALHSSLTGAVWSDITSRFRMRVVQAPQLPLLVTEHWMFRLSAYYKVYGTYLTEPGTENVTLDVDRTGLALEGAAGIQGYAAPDSRLESLDFPRKKASVRPEQSVLFAVVDRETGAIVVIGADTAP